MCDDMAIDFLPMPNSVGFISQMVNGLLTAGTFEFFAGRCWELRYE
jgi:hypothetical protein